MSDEMARELIEAQKDYSARNTIDQFVANCRENLFDDDSEFKKHEEEQRQLRLKEIEERKIKHYKEESGAPSRYWNESLDTYKPTPENQNTFNWIKGFMKAVNEHKNSKNIVFITGKRGTGKTHLGCGLVRELEGKIINSFKLCIEFDSCRDFNSKETRVQYLDRLCKNEVLVIDEVGKGIESIEKSLLPYILNEFYGSGKILFFLGNINKDDFNKLISGDGEDRMKEVGVYLSLSGESFRDTNKASTACAGKA